MGTEQKRKNKPPVVNAVRFLYSSPIRVGDRPPVLYEVGDSFPLTAKKVQHQIGATVRNSTAPPDFVGVLVRNATPDLLLVPSTDVLVSFPPVPGRGHYASNIRTSVIFWDDSFWSPVLAVEPERDELLTEVYGELSGWGLDVLFKVEALELPDRIQDRWEFNTDPATTPWTGP